MACEVLKIKSFASSLASDGSLILNIAGKVSLLKVEGTNIEKINEFAVLKNPSRAAFSLDMKMIAYKSTTGKIAIHDIETGGLILKHNAVKREGCGLHFVLQNQKILSSTWDCDIFLLDITSGDVTKSRIGDGEYHGAPILPGM